MSVMILESINIAPLLSAFDTFAEAVAVAKSQLEKDGAIQRFEYTYELFWKILRKILKYQGLVCDSPRSVFREAAIQSLLDDSKFWFEVLRKRNLTTHTYNLEVAAEIFDSLEEIKVEMEKVIKHLKTL